MRGTLHYSPTDLSQNHGPLQMWFFQAFIFLVTLLVIDPEPWKKKGGGGANA